MRDGGQDILYGVDGLMDHQLTEAVFVVTVITHRIFIGFRVLQFLRLQLDVLGRTSVALQHVSNARATSANVSISFVFAIRCGTLVPPTRRKRTERIFHLNDHLSQFHSIS